MKKIKGKKGENFISINIAASAMSLAPGTTLATGASVGSAYQSSDC